jgi:hypothetical protein
MNFDINTWNINQYKAAGKHAASYIAGGVSVAVLFHFISPSDANSINENLNTVYHGIEEIAKGVAGIIGVLTPIYTAWRAAHNAGPVQQATLLEKAVPGTVIVTAPEVAAAVPSSNVVSNTETKILPKV